jgi:predicted transcriptional regulator
MHIQVHTANMNILECFSSETRVRMIELMNDHPRSISELAEALSLSSAIITKHIQKLEGAGLVATESVTGTRGRRKVCHLVPDSLMLQLKSRPAPDPNLYAVSIPIGQYSNCNIQPTCGLASTQGVIGLVDDPRYFQAPERAEAAHLWFGSGFVEYRIPNYLVAGQRAHSLVVSLELCSEAPGYNEQWPSDLSFYLNDQLLGVWTCPGDFGASRGVFTPEWWNHGTQHGLLKILSIRPEGSFIDGLKLSDVTAASLAIGFNDEIRLKIACPETARYCGGLSLFGKQFGNYNQDITVTVYYEI